jgi:hypothetical protein
MDPRCANQGRRLSARAEMYQDTQALPERVAAVVDAADIPPSKLGAARRAQLDEAERDLYFWILRGFSSHGRPNRERVHDVAAQLCGESEAAFERLARDDLVHLDADGEIAVGYPFSGHPTAHRVRFPSGHETFAMCAIDALGIAPMFDQAIEINSLDPLTGAPIHVRVAPEGDATWEPDTAAVGAGALGRHGDACDSCCSDLNFFATQENAERWFDGRSHTRGRVVSMDDAIAAGRAVFGNVFEH